MQMRRLTKDQVRNMGLAAQQAGGKALNEFQKVGVGAAASLQQNLARPKLSFGVNSGFRGGPLAPV